LIVEPERMKHFESLLKDKKHEIEATLKKMHDNGYSFQSEQRPGELSNYDNHPAELGTDLFQLEMNNALLVHERNQLNDVEDALKKISRNEYGKCELCNNEISEERLEVVPQARLCIDCENSKQVTHTGRPVEEKVIDAPFGRKYLNKREDDEYEGMDYLNDLVKYGSSDGPQDMGGYRDYKNYYTNEEDKQGIVDKMDNISNRTYKKQLP